MSDFDRLLEEQIPRLRRYARALTRNFERADDLVQDTLVRALTKQHLWQAGTNLRAWLFTLMHNQNVNDVRHSIREGQNIDVEEMSNVLAATTDPTASRQLCELDRALGLIPRSHFVRSWKSSRSRCAPLRVQSRRLTRCLAARIYSSYRIVVPPPFFSLFSFNSLPSFLLSIPILLFLSPSPSSLSFPPFILFLLSYLLFYLSLLSSGFAEYPRRLPCFPSPFLFLTSILSFLIFLLPSLPLSACLHQFPAS